MSSSPRILVLFGNVPLLGQERANIETLHALKESGCEVRFLIRSEYTSDSIQPELRRRGLEFVTVPYFESVRYGQSLRVWWRNVRGILGGSWHLLRQIREFRATHIHLGSTTWALNFLPALLATRLPLVFRAGDVPAAHHGLWRWVWRFTRHRAAHFVCDSKFIQGKLAELGVPVDRSSVIFAPAPRRGAPPQQKPVADMSDKRFAVLYVGQISRSKGVHLLVDAALEMCRVRPAIRFLIAGNYDWNNPFAEELIARVREAGKADQICFTGFVEDIEPLYKMADVHMCPSLWEEPYGLTVLEAKERGVPSVVFASGGLPELVTHGVDGLVCNEKTAAALRSAIETYAVQPELAARHGLAALASLDRLGIDQFAQKWRAVYARVGCDQDGGVV